MMRTHVHHLARFVRTAVALVAVTIAAALWLRAIPHPTAQVPQHGAPAGAGEPAPGRREHGGRLQGAHDNVMPPRCASKSMTSTWAGRSVTVASRVDVNGPGPARSFSRTAIRCRPAGTCRR